MSETRWDYNRPDFAEEGIHIENGGAIGRGYDDISNLSDPRLNCAIISYRAKALSNDS